MAAVGKGRGQALGLCQEGIVAAWLQALDAAAVHHNSHLLQLHRLLRVRPLHMPFDPFNPLQAPLAACNPLEFRSPKRVL